MKPKKTDETRARELFKMVHGFEPLRDPEWELYKPGWINLGWTVLRLEAKRAKAKRHKKSC